MKKEKILAQAITLGLLLAAPLGASAANELVLQGDTYTGTGQVGVHSAYECNGEYKVAVTENAGGSATLIVYPNGSINNAALISANTLTNSGTINTKDIQITGKIVNAGTLKTDSLSANDVNNTGTLNINGSVNAKSLLNTGETTFGENISFADSFSLNNRGTLYVSSGELISENLTITNGLNINDKNAKILGKDGEALNVLKIKKLDNRVTLNAGYIEVTESISNQGTLDTQSIAGDTQNANYKKGTLKAGGFITNHNKGSIKAEQVIAGTTIDNKGILETDSISAGESILNKAGAEMLAAVVNAGGSLNNDGKLEADTLKAEANIRNNNEMTIKDTLEAQTFFNQYDATSDIGTLNVNRLENKDKANLKVDNLQVKENGELIFNSTTDATIDNLSGSDINTSLGKGSGKVNIGTITEDTSMTIHASDIKDGLVSVGQNNSKNITVAAGSEVTDTFNPNDLAGSMQKVADVVTVENGVKSLTVTTEGGSVLGALTTVTDADGKVGAVKEAANAYNAGISEMASIGLMTWRAENDDMNKRMGELRDSKGEHGLWARMTRGESKYGAQNIKNQYSRYELGYDEKLSVDKHWTVGAALNYTDGKSSFANGSGENKHTGLSVYGSYLSDSGSFVDLIVKYARLDNEFDVFGGAGKGDYDTNGYSISAEYGKRFMKDNGLWIEPQVQLNYGYVGAVNYLTNNDVNVRQEGMDSLVGRAGFALGKNIKQGNVYLRASYLYDFDGKTDVSFSRNGATRSFEQDLGSGWWEVGVGANINLSDATHLYFDVEKTYGGNVATPWQWNAGVRWSF